MISLLGDYYYTFPEPAPLETCALDYLEERVRRLQGSYVYRRRLFIELFARPNGWKFTEAIF